MRITLIDDSIPFDGFTPGNRPLGGAEKAFASLPGALVRRGHQVTVINRCRFAMTIEGAQWLPFDKERPAAADLLVAYRRPELLGAIRNSAKRVLWLAQPARLIAKQREVLDAYKPILVFQSRAHHETWHGLLTACMIPPGVRQDYLNEAVPEPVHPPRAVCTTHPAHGLDWLIRLWVERVHPACPEAELHVYSAVLDKGQTGQEVPDGIKPVLAQALAARAQGVIIHAPKSDPGMAEAYLAARVHLYPGHVDDMASWTLAESQALGLPAVARPLGAAPERIRNAETGYVVPDDEAFANVTLQLLTNGDLFWGMNRDCRLHQRDRSWDAVAADFEAIAK